MHTQISRDTRVHVKTCLFILGGGGGGGKRGVPTPKNPFLFQKCKMGFLTLFFLLLVFLGLNLKNDIMILILYLKSKNSDTHIIMFLLKHR